MLIISGSAEFIGDTNKFTQGDSHAFTMFCSNENLNDELQNIEEYFNGLNWDKIIIEESGIIEDDSKLENNTLKQAFNNAVRDKLSVVIRNEPIYKVA